MATYRGNRGNLLQHWVLVDLLEALSNLPPAHLCYFDAHSMSPTASRSPKVTKDQTAHEFDRVRLRLSTATSTYEQAWRSLSASLGSEYPSSSAVVRAIWQGPLHLLLCVVDRETATEITDWLTGLDGSTTSHKLHCGEWQSRIGHLPSGFDAYYMSFDPNMYDRHDVKSPKRENMYGTDIAVAGKAVAGLPHVPVVVQLSTYSVNGGNSQSDVVVHLSRLFARFGLQLSARVCADKSMMSLVFTRDVAVNPDLERRFRSWLAGRSTGAA